MTRVSVSFLPLWTLAVAAATSAFVMHLALRGRTVQLGYELGHARQEQARLREVERVMELEAASYRTPERIEIVARTLLGMEAPPSERIVSLAPLPGPDDHPEVTAFSSMPARVAHGHGNPAAVSP
ncbi:MAG: cell division protein FtsL [Polyangiaceae bacterium]|jgi:cell division protein FtsL